MKLIIGVVFVCFVSLLNGQEYKWDYVNPWRFQKIMNPKVINDYYYFQTGDDLDIVMRLGKDVETFDTIVDYNIQIQDYAILNEKTGFVTVKTSPFVTSVFKLNLEEGTEILLYEVQEADQIELEIIGENLFFLVRKKSKVYRYHNDTLTEVFAFEEEPGIGYHLFMSREDVLLIRRLKKAYISSDLGETWNVVERDQEIFDFQIFDDFISIPRYSQFIDIYDLQGKLVKIQTYNFEGSSVTYRRIHDLLKFENTMYLTSEDVLLASSDEGETWFSLPNQFQKYRNSARNALIYQGHLVFLSDSGLEKINLKTNARSQLNSLRLTTNPQVAQVNDSLLIMYENSNSSYGSLHRSYDYGITWDHEIIALEPHDSLNSSTLYYYSPQEAYLKLKDGTVTKSGDNLETFEEINKLPVENLASVTILGDNNCLKIQSNKYFLSTDQGNSYEELSIGVGSVSPMNRDLHVIDENHFWLTNQHNGNLYFSEITNGVLTELVEYPNIESPFNILGNDQGVIISDQTDISFFSYEKKEVEAIGEFFGSPFMFYFDGSTLFGYNSYDGISKYTLTSAGYDKEVQLIEGAEIKFEPRNIKTNSKGEILIVAEHPFSYTLENTLIKYGPPIDKGIYLNNEIEKEYSREELDVYPNPFSDYLHIDSELLLTHYLYTIDGQLILTSNEMVIPTSDLSQGIYVLVSTEDGKVVSKFKLVK